MAVINLLTFYLSCLVTPVSLFVKFRACERLKLARIQQARPDAEKAARTQELHKKLRVQQQSTFLKIIWPDIICLPKFLLL